MILVDTNVLLDWLTQESPWHAWAKDELDRLAQTEALTINPLIFAEVAAGFRRPSDLDRALPNRRFERLDLPYEAAFLAGQAFRRYKHEEEGEKRSPMPDFYIGAHASFMEIPLLTRDVRRFRTYFPDLRLITPPGL